MARLLPFACSYIRLKCTDAILNEYGSEEIVVTTTYGPVIGFRRRTSENEYLFIAFKGIPYAKPPLGTLRFKAPVPPDPWSDPPTRFFRGGSLAPQLLHKNGKVIGSEDCLHLCVYTRNLTPRVLAPVMVWIHGGAFAHGSITIDMYDPEYLLRDKIVLVAMNYRLGAFGFLAFNDPALCIPGNAGLKDQCLALKWVKDNIQFFGGDPDNITLFGQDAGGVSAHLHCVADMSAGLFHKAIMLSGNIYTEWATNTVPKPTLELAKELLWDGKNGERGMYEVIHRSSIKRILHAQAELLTPDHQQRFIFAAFVPSVELYESEQCFLLDSPFKLVRNCWSKKIPIIQGYVSNEGYAFYDLVSLRGKMQYVAPSHEFGLNYDSKKNKQASLLIQGFYFGFSDPNLKANQQTKLSMLSDKYFLHAFHRNVLLRSSDADFGPTYLYRFNFKSKDKEPTHDDDLKYYFKSSFEPKSSQHNGRERIVIDRLCSILVSFAKHGDPNNQLIASEHWRPLQRPAIHSSTGDPIYTVYDVSDVVQQIPLPEAERMHFWDYLYAKHGCKLF